MTEKRINPDTGILEEKRWHGWTASENPDGCEERVNPDTGVCEEKRWHGWTASENAEGREERVNPNTGVHEEKRWYGWPSKDNSGSERHTPTSQRQSAKPSAIGNGSASSDDDNSSYSSSGAPNNSDTGTTGGLFFVVVLVVGLIIMALSAQQDTTENHIVPTVQRSPSNQNYVGTWYAEGRDDISIKVVQIKSPKEFEVVIQFEDGDEKLFGTLSGDRIQTRGGEQSRYYFSITPVSDNCITAYLEWTFCKK